MSEVKFIDGLRAFKPHKNAPDFVKAAIEINVSELQQWLSQNGEEKVRLDLKESKSGTYYCSVNDFKPKPQGEQSSRESHSPPPPADDFDSEFPF